MGNTANGAWERYDRLNDAIVDELFGEGAAGKPVYLDLERDVLSRIAERMGDRIATDPDEMLCEVVRATLPPPDVPIGVFRLHRQRVQLWELEKSNSPPPCLGVLALLSLVAERMKQTEEFAGSNYYGRLLQTLGIEPQFLARVGREFRRDTPPLWDALNRWLEESDGHRGLPTAVAFDRRKFIGLPLSQALIRAQDRAKLPVLFAQYGLQSGQRVSVEAMQELLAEWVPNSQVTPSLKRLWRKRSNRDRISEVVCAELEGWDGMLPEELRPTEYKLDESLFLAAEVRGFPHPAIELLLLARHDGREPVRSAILSADATGAAMKALGPLGEGMSLRHIPGTSWEIVEPNELVSYPHLLIANASLEVSNSGVNCTRQARHLVLLKWSEADHLFIEARRAELLETYTILVLSDLAGPVREVLRTAARKGWREMNSGSLAGLPPAWTAFQDVQLERIASISMEDLAPLQPIARTHIALGGGLPLPGMNVWHGDRLPELRVVVGEQNETEAAHVRAMPIRHLDGREEENIPLAEIKGTGVVDLSKVPELREGDFRIVVTSPQKKRTLATARLRVRSGSWPRRLREGEDIQVEHVILEEGRLRPFADRTAGERPTAKVIGAQIENVTLAADTEAASIASALPTRPGILVEDVELDGWDPTESQELGAAENLPICFTRGYHHWLCSQRKGREPLYSICKDCGREKWWELKRRKRSTRTARRVGPSTSSAEAIGHPALPEIPKRAEADMELVLDALSYVKTGPWRSLRSITAPIDDSPWFAHEAARHLEALGHIEIEFDGKSMAPKWWCIAPPTIVVPERGPCFLAGSRSAKLMQTVEKVVTGELAGKILVIPQSNGPHVVEIHGLESDELTLLIDEIVEKHDQELGLSVRPASRIAALLPPLGMTRILLPELTTSARRLDRFELDPGRWRPAEKMDSPGAYRLRNRPWIYAVVPPATDTARQRSVVTDVRLAKYLAAKDACFSLVGYEERSRTLVASAGAPLPGLLERVAVLCSGRLPTRRADGTLAYERVPPTIAEAIWEACTTRN